MEVGLFRSKEEKQAIKEYQAKLKAAGRTKLMFIEHIGGHPKLPANTMINVQQGLEKNTLSLSGELIRVIGIEWDEQGQRSVGKAAAGAIVGGVLTGGLGMIAGAAIGAKKKDNSIAIINYVEGDYEGTIYLRADSKKYQELVSML